MHIDVAVQTPLLLELYFSTAGSVVRILYFVLPSFFSTIASVISTQFGRYMQRLQVATPLLDNKPVQ